MRLPSCEVAKGDLPIYNNNFNLCGLLSALYSGFFLLLLSFSLLGLPISAKADETINFGIPDDTFAAIGTGDWKGVARLMIPASDEGYLTPKLYLYKHGTPTGHMKVSIQGESSSLPNGTPVVSDLFDVSTLPSGSSATDCSEITLPNLVYAFTGSGHYFLVFEVNDLTADASNYVQTCWKSSESDGGYRKNTSNVWSNLGFGSISGSAVFLTSAPGGGGSGTSTASSTTATSTFTGNDDGTHFGIAIIIFLLSLGVLGMVANAFKKK